MIGLDAGGPAILIVIVIVIGRLVRHSINSALRAWIVMFDARKARQVPPGWFLW